MDNSTEPSLNGIHLRVLMQEYAPFWMITYDSNGGKQYHGICWDLLLALAAALKFTFTIDQPQDGAWGNLDPVKGWYGILGEVFRGEADLGLPISVTEQRSAAFDFSFPFWQEPCGVAVRLESDAAPDLWFLKPFSQTVWLLLLGSYLVLSLCLWGFPYLSNYINPVNNSDVWCCKDTFWFMFGVLVNQGGNVRKHGIWRIITVPWWLVNLVLINGIFVGNLVAFLATSVYKPPFNTLGEMVNNTAGYTYGTTKGIFLEQLFVDSTSGDYAEVGKYIKTHEESFSPNEKSGLERAMNDKYAFMGELSVLDAGTVDICNVTLIKEQFYVGKWAIVVQKNWKYRAALNKGMMRIVESGLINKWKAAHWPIRKCRGQGTFAEVSKVNIQGLTSVFSLLFVGIMVAIIVLCAENIIHAWLSRGSQQNKSSAEEQPPPVHCEDISLEYIKIIGTQKALNTELNNVDRTFPG